MPQIVSEIKKQVFDRLEFEMKNVCKEMESEEYCAHTFELNNRKIIFRNAKTTPKKVGQFVTLWKRNPDGITQSFELSDDFDFAIINAKSENRRGQFVFPKSVLFKQGIISDNQKQGKRGFRVYPIWDKVTNSQASKTQQWQLQYFLEITQNIDLERARLLYA